MDQHVCVLGLGAMGHALAQSLITAGTSVTVWNRTARAADSLIAQGAHGATDAAAAVTASPLVVVCLYDHQSVREVLDPLTDQLRGRTLVNVTTTTPTEARELATWAADHDIEYLDGAIMAVPSMIGTEHASIFYSGSERAFDACRPLLDRWASSTFEGDDPGRASLLDLAMLAAMYTMVAGFLHGAAMVAADGVPPEVFAVRATPFLAAMTGSFARYAEVAASGDYARPDEQSLAWTDLNRFVRASDEQGVTSSPIAMVAALAQQQIEDGHGADAFARIYESLRAQTTSTGSTSAGSAPPSSASTGSA